MRRLPFARPVLLALLGLSFVWEAPQALGRERTTATAPLADRLGARVAASGARPGKLGVLVLDLATGATVYARDADAALVPASVAKLATSVAALDLLGPGYEFETSLDARGTFDAASGTLTGDLIVHGAGDPGLSKRGHETDPLWPLSTFAKAIASRGVRRVVGSVVLDDGPFDRQFVHPSWRAKDLDDWYGAPVAGLNFNDACVTVLVTAAASDGQAARVSAPSSSGPWPLGGSVRTWDERRTEVGALWTQDRASLQVSGGIPAGQDYAFDTPVPDPLRYFGGAFLAALRLERVEVSAGTRLAATAADREPGTRVASVSNALGPTLRIMNKHSQNLYAEQLFKACGAEREGLGSWASGERAVTAVLLARGIRMEGLRVVDGSGLSTESRLSAASVARLLVSLDADPLRGPLLRDSLAVPGQEGTLSKRLKDPASRARLRAKTGTLGHTGVHALAGTVDGASGGRGLAFAILCNDTRLGESPRDLIEALVREMLEE